MASMRIQTVQVVTALLAAVAFVLAFISAGVAIISSLFALLGSAALGWLIFVMGKRALAHRAQRNIAPPNPSA